jgi:hypothetical protein
MVNNDNLRGKRGHTTVICTVNTADTDASKGGGGSSDTISFRPFRVDRRSRCCCGLVPLLEPVDGPLLLLPLLIVWTQSANYPTKEVVTQK